MNIYVPSEQRMRMSAYPEINWSNIARDAFEIAMQNADRIRATMLNIDTSDGTLQVYHDRDTLVMHTADGSVIRLAKNDAAKFAAALAPTTTDADTTE